MDHMSGEMDARRTAATAVLGDDKAERRSS
jgi:hypothetical protein